MNNIKILFTLLTFTLCISCFTKQIYKDALIIKGGTIIDLSKNGTSINDLSNKAIIIKADTIFKIVEASSISEAQKMLLTLQVNI